MDQLIEFFTNILGTSDWPPRWICGKWSDFHGWLYILSDITIWLAYFLIPIILIWFIQQRPSLPFLPVFWLFGAFIILCGATHLLDAIIFWWPAYRLSAILRFVTAVVSMITAFSLIRDLPKALDFATKTSDTSVKELVKENEAKWLQDLKEKNNTIRDLRAEIDILKQRYGN